MEAPTASKASSSSSDDSTPRSAQVKLSLLTLSPVARFWTAVVIFLLASVLALFQVPRPDPLRPPRWFASGGWWRYPLEWNAASRLPKIECGLNAIQAVPNTSSVWAVGNKGMVVASSDGGRTWTNKNLAQAQAAPAASPTASPSLSPSPKSPPAQAAFLHLPDLITTASAASEPPVGAQSKPPEQKPTPSPTPSPIFSKPTPTPQTARPVTATPTPTPSRSSSPLPVRGNASPSPSSSSVNASPTATPPPTFSPTPNATPTPTEIEALIAVSFVDA